MSPEVGDIVIFHPAGGADKDQDCAAIVTKVWSPGTVNLTVFEQHGGTSPRTSVVKRNPMATTPDNGYTWSKRGTP